MDINGPEALSVSFVNAKAAERRSSGFSLRNLFTPPRKSRESPFGPTAMSFGDRNKTTQDFLNSEKQFASDTCDQSVSFIMECQICLTDQPLSKFHEMTTCSHRFCSTCLQTFLKTEISESRVNIHCPWCPEEVDPHDIRSILQDNSLLMEKYENFMLRRTLISDPGVRWCPAPDCGYAVVAKDCGSCPRLKCERPGCNTYFCFNCKDYWHQNDTCDAESVPIMTSSSISPGDVAQMEGIRPCPKCSSPIEKLQDGSCNHMVCPVCAEEFCWLCMKPITANMLHFAGPSGCSFWGKKAMSKKKKVITHLATLFGAPVAVSVMAGLAVPALVVGFPAYVGRMVNSAMCGKDHNRFNRVRIHDKYRYRPAPKRNLAMTAGIAASILTSPVVAGVAVGIGVPVSLAYIYGTTTKALISGSFGVKNITKK